MQFIIQKQSKGSLLKLLRAFSKLKRIMKDNTDYSSLYKYPTNVETTTFPGFGPQDEALKEFTQRKRGRVPKENPNEYQKKHGVKGVDAVRMDVIEDNLLLVGDTSKGLQTSKSYPIKVRNSTNEDIRSRMAKLVAYSLVKKGYGFNLYQSYIDQQNAYCLMQTRQKYKSTAISIMQRAYRKLQQFLRVQCDKRVKALRHEQIRYLIRYLTKFNIYFKKNEAATMAKIISLIQELHPVTISSNEAINLYLTILKILTTVLTGGAVNPAVEQPVYDKAERKKKRWEVKYDEQLIQFYQLNQSYPKIHKCFITIHPDLSEDISEEFIQQQMERIFRQILRKLRQFSHKEGFSQLIQLNQNKSNYILKSPACRQIRLTLLDFRQIDHISDKAGFNDIVSIINHKFDFNPDNTQRKVLKHHKAKEGFETSLGEKPIKYARTLDQEKAQDWSKSVSVAPRNGYCIKGNHYQNRNMAQLVKSNRFEVNSEEEYSDS